MININGRKIISDFENPIDNILITICEHVSTFLYNNINFITPNIITTISLILSCIAIYLIYHKYYKIGAILYFIGYFFDCLDGYYARKYSMITKIGDYYDHISDIIKYILLLYIIIISNLKYKTKLYIIIIIVILTILSLIHLGLQELNIKNEFKDFISVLNILNKINFDKEYIIYSKYVGTGTVYLVIFILTFFLKEINDKIS